MIASSTSIHHSSIIWILLPITTIVVSILAIALVYLSHGVALMHGGGLLLVLLMGHGGHGLVVGGGQGISYYSGRFLLDYWHHLLDVVIVLVVALDRGRGEHRAGALWGRGFYLSRRVWPWD